MKQRIFLNYRNRDLSGQVFKGFDLSGADFSKAKLDGIQFIDCDLTDCSFIFTDLETAVFKGCIFRNNSFFGSFGGPIIR